MSSTPLRVMFDTNIYDAIAANAGFTERLITLVDNGLLDIVASPVEAHELESIRDVAKLNAIGRIPRRYVPAMGISLGETSWIGEARISNDEMEGMRYDDIHTVGGSHGRDAVIAMTAAVEADVLITNDKRLRTRVGKADAELRCWDFDTFQAEIGPLISSLDERRMS